MRPAWHNDAACRGGDMIHVFFPKLISRQHLGRVKQICASCPVRQQCAEWGRNESYGIWAGGYDFGRHR